MEYAYEGDQLTGEGQPSIFTAAVVEGLETGKADLDHDQLISVDDLYDYVYDRVKDGTPGQTPSKKSDLEGPLYLAKSSYRPPVVPATLDPDLVARTEDRFAGIREGAVLELAELLHASDPAVALAARELLIRMTGEDSRRVSAAAETALAAAQPATPEPAPAAFEEAAPKPARPEPAPPEPSRQRFRPDRRLAMPLVILVLVAVGFLILRPGGVGDEGAQQGGGGSTPSSVSTGVPTTLTCTSDPDGWLKTDHGAQRHLECEPPTPPPKGLDAISYGEFADAEQAHREFDGALEYHTEQRAAPCPAAARQRMREVFTAGRTACFRDKYLFLWWNGDSSPVWGSLAFVKATKTEDAVAAWENILTTA
jgi:hypothetical protein